MKIEAGSWAALVVTKTDTYLIFTWAQNCEPRAFALRSQHARPVWWRPVVLNGSDVDVTDLGFTRTLRRIGLGWLIFTVEAIWTPTANKTSQEARLTP